MTTQEIRVLLVGDQSLLQVGINTLLADIVDVNLVGTSANSNRAVRLCQTVQPDVLIFVSTHFEAQVMRQLVHKYPAVKVLVIQVDENDIYMKKLVDSGALGCFLYSDPPEKFVEAIHTVARGKPWFSHSLYKKFVQFEMLNITCGLTQQELEVLQLVVAEKTDREIAQTFNLSERNVRRILRCIYDKVGVNSRAGAAFQAGILGLLAGNGRKFGRT